MDVELKALFLGMLFSLGSFGIKSGIGLDYFLRQPRRGTRKAVFLLIYGLVYLVIFGSSALVIKTVELTAYYSALQNFLQYGMVFHVLLAGGLIWWGVALLRRPDPGRLSRFGWAPLIIPCPVCFTVIFFSIGLLLSFFPDSPYRVTLAVYGTFIGLNLLTLAALRLGTRSSRNRPEKLLAQAMLILAVYFVACVLLLPHFAELERIYHLASYQSDKKTLNIGELIGTGVILTLVFLAGFLTRVSPWRR